MNTDNSRRRKLPDHIADAMTAILDYFWQDEVRDYLARSRQDQAGHIFNELLTVRQWLAARQRGKQGEPKP